MKTLIFFLVIITFACLVQAQEKPDKLKSIPFDDKIPWQKDSLFDSFPQFKLPDLEAPALTDKLFNYPGDINEAHNSASSATDYFHMPIVRPGSGFSSNMTISVPDSSVHYHILQKKIDMKMLQQETK